MGLPGWERSMTTQITVDREKIAEFCRRWKITELSLFGSVLRDDFRPGSDVDVLVTFAPDAQWSLFDAVEMEQELSTIFGRKVDLISRRPVSYTHLTLPTKRIV